LRPRAPRRKRQQQQSNPKDSMYFPEVHTAKII
jgi:hypothetical protein